MRKLRNIGYLRFGSQIRQCFAGGITSLTPSLSLSGSRGQKMRARGKGRSFIFGAGACRPAGGRQAPAKDLCAKKFYFYLHIGPYRPSAGRQAPCCPPAGR